jgi:hypothetical protein
MPEKWKESIIVPIHKKNDKTDCNNYRNMSLLSRTYKILSTFLLSELTPYEKDIIGDYKCGFGRSRSTTDHLFSYIRQVVDKKWEYKEQVLQLFIEFKKAYDSFRREFLCIILIEYGISLKLVRLIKICLNEVYIRVRVGRHFICFLLGMVGNKEMLHRHCFSTLL